MELVQNGGVQYVPQIAIQYIYLDFDGELTSYNGEILTVDDVEVKDSALTEERVKNILAELNAKYADQKVVFVTERPAAAEYSTIFIGKTSAFDQYGNFAGLAETIDKGNINKTDKAFVNLDTNATDTEIIATIAHEADHLLGTLNHGGEGLQAYADGLRYDVLSGITSSGITLYYDSMYVSSGGTATDTTVNEWGELYVSSGGTATNTTVNEGGYLYVENSGTATNTTVDEWGNIYVSSGGTATDTTVNEEGALYVSSGGTATDTTVNEGGTLCVESGGTATAITANAGARLFFTVAPDTCIQGTSAGSSVEITNGYVSGYTVNEGGFLFVSSGGTATDTTVDEGGELYVDSGGTATIKENGGAVNIGVGANVTFVFIASAQKNYRQSRYVAGQLQL